MHGVECETVCVCVCVYAAAATTTTVRQSGRWDGWKTGRRWRGTPARRDIRKIREKIIKKYKLNVVFTYSVKSPGRMYKKRA